MDRTTVARPEATLEFLPAVKALRRTLNIRPGKSTDRDRRRIALAVADAWL